MHYKVRMSSTAKGSSSLFFKPMYCELTRSTQRTKCNFLKFLCRSHFSFIFLSDIRCQLLVCRHWPSVVIGRFAAYHSQKFDTRIILVLYIQEMFIGPFAFNSAIIFSSVVVIRPLSLSVRCHQKGSHHLTVPT